MTGSRMQAGGASNAANGLYASPGGMWDPHKTPNIVEQRVQRMIEILRRHTDTVSQELAGNVAKLDQSLIAHMVQVLEQERGDLLTALIQLPTGSALMMEGFATADRVSDLLTRLNTIAAAHGSHTSLALPDARADDKAAVFMAAEQEAPAGYCDSAPQGKEPCDLDPTTRDRYRRHVTVVTGKASNNWKNAIARAAIEEKLKTNALTFEQQLGEILFGLLFNVFGNVAKTVARGGLAKLDRMLTAETWDEDLGIVRRGIDPSNMKLGHAVIDTVVDKTSPVAQSKLKAGITAQQLTQQAKQPVSSNRVSFIESLKSLPDKWHDTIIRNLEQLFDADLAALVTSMPLESPSLTVEAFEQRIDDTVTRFQNQVLSIGTISMTPARPVKVIGAGGVKLALVEPEQRPNKDMHGEWKYVDVNTGKFKFVRWIDDDMKEMALGRARQHDAYADTQMKAAGDSTFWDSDSLQILAREMSALPPQQEIDQ